MNEHDKEKTYVDAIQRLQEIASDLESGRISIDALEAVILESRNLVNMCQEKLRSLENRIDRMDEEQS